MIPETLTVVFDVRLTVDVDHEEFENMVNSNLKLYLVFYFKKNANCYLLLVQFILFIYFFPKVLGWCKEAGEGVTIEFEQKNPKVGATQLDESNIYWIAFKKAADEMYVLLFSILGDFYIPKVEPRYFLHL